MDQTIQILQTIKKIQGLNINQKRFLSVFTENMCNVSKSCIAIGVSRQFFYDWVKLSTVFAEAVLNLREGIIDRVESMLFKTIFDDKNITGMIFYLKTQGKGRGWSERFDIDLEKETKTLFQSADDKKLIAETRKKLALLDLLLVTEDQGKKLKMIEEFKK